MGGRERRQGGKEEGRKRKRKSQTISGVSEHGCGTTGIYDPR